MLATAQQPDILEAEVYSKVCPVHGICFLSNRGACPLCEIENDEKGGELLDDDG